jgi:hypothetical protein
MANREIVQPGGAGIYPLTGDVASTAGNSAVRVIGLQGLPLEAGVPPAGAGLQFNQDAVQWQPTLIATIQVNGITVSDDPWVSVNARKPIKINGA